jgi:hypothetical protein
MDLKKIYVQDQISKGSHIGSLTLPHIVKLEIPQYFTRGHTSPIRHGLPGPISEEDKRPLNVTPVPQIWDLRLEFKVASCACVCVDKHVFVAWRHSQPVARSYGIRTENNKHIIKVD